MSLIFTLNLSVGENKMLRETIKDLELCLSTKEAIGDKTTGTERFHLKTLQWLPKEIPKEKDEIDKREQTSYVH